MNYLAIAWDKINPLGCGCLSYLNKRFLYRIPILEEPDFVSHWEYLYERSWGSVGILKNWSRNTFADALEDGSKTVTLKYLERRALSIGQCRNILKKIKQGEDRYTEIEGKVEELRKELELGAEPVSRTQKVSKSHTNSNQNTNQPLHLDNIAMKKIIQSLIEKKYSSNNLYQIYSYTGVINGKGEMALDIANALAKLTFNEQLKLLSLTSFSEIFPTRGLLSKYRSWCPQCYESWKLN